MQVDLSLLLALGFDADSFATAVRDFQQALVDHTSTVDVPAPQAAPLVEHVVRNCGGQYTVVDDTPQSPAVPPAGPPTVTGNQWAFALSSLGLSAAWQVGVTKSKASDQVRIGLIARDTPLLASDPLLLRVSGNAGVDGSGNPLITVATVFSSAQGMPT